MLVDIFPETKYGQSFRRMGIYELNMRGGEIKGRNMRPEHKMIAHTGFIFVARKCSTTTRKLL
jgi:tRNA A58 N-methylase Trm61